MSAADNQCLKCKSANVTAGKLVADDGPSVRFQPERSGLWTVLVRNGASVLGPVLACLDCGHLWGSLSAEDLKKSVPRHGQKPKPDTWQPVKKAPGEGTVP